ncbi:hypothetical protein [Acidiphilium acidophilum]|uniref:hypothetical protein n=1 Tax=Acidiphilium acidophilum TaxID=76588 RepID=UPI002E8E6D50|nr:hypothetical protein [Acidiphilium acidophilum]
MDALNGEELPDPDEALRAAQDALLQTEKMAALVNDPITQPLRAIRMFLTAFGATANLHRMTTKRDFHAVHQIQSRLDKSITLAVDAARADVAKAHAEMAQSLIGSISARASAELSAMSRRLWFRNVILASALPVLALMIGGGIGYWQGYQAGHHATATIIRSAEPIARAVVASGGPVALHDWNNLMTDNPIVAVMNKCHGNNLGKQDGRTACHMWLWITPPVPPSPHGRQ